ncbi:MAG: DUF58 domain-containing protein [Planctomycetes bacterium]|nr:DUF58 domain-containing protein [Planctomycetota bacterium]
MAAKANFLPYPRVVFASDFLARIERFSAELAAARARGDEFGGRAVAAGGHDFVGYRPYHAGDDPRLVDWSAYARLDRALVRITRREAGERLLVCVDASASMGAGPPGKWQRAAEVACALVALALREGSTARICITPAEHSGLRSLMVDKPARLVDLLNLFTRIQAGGRGGGAEVLRDDPEFARGGGGARFVISDFSACDPEPFRAHAQRGSDLNLIRILAPHELGLAPDGPVDWFDPERGEHLELEVETGVRARYAVLLAAELERWRTALATALGVRHSVHSSAEPFEDIVRGSLARC